MKANLSLPSPRQSTAKKHVLVYFIPGNPGVVEFYTDFLRALRDLLDKTETETETGVGTTTTTTTTTHTAYDIYARNLLGFHDEDHSPAFSASNPPYGLRAQVDGIWADVASQRATPTTATTITTTPVLASVPYDAIILIGHSIGAYIAIELFHRHHETLLRQYNPAVNHPPPPPPPPPLRHAVLLFPTISHLARSPSGRLLTWLQTRGGAVAAAVETNLHHAARVLLFPWPRAALRWLWAASIPIPWFWSTPWRRLGFGFSAAAAEAVAAWLGSRDGVWQAIHLGRSELRLIGAGEENVERWDGTAGFWAAEAEAAADKVVVPRFFFFYGKYDHWVDNGSRDAFIARHEVRMAAAAAAAGGGGGVDGAARARRQGPRFHVDEGDHLPHAFCTRQDTSLEVAQKVYSWIQEIDVSMKG